MDIPCSRGQEYCPIHDVNAAGEPIKYRISCCVCVSDIIVKAVLKGKYMRFLQTLLQETAYILSSQLPGCKRQVPSLTEGRNEA